MAIGLAGPKHVKSLENMYEYNCYVETPNRIGKAEGTDFIVEQDELDTGELSFSRSQLAKTIEGESILHSKPYMELEIKLVSEGNIKIFNPTS